MIQRIGLRWSMCVALIAIAGCDSTDATSAGRTNSADRTSETSSVTTASAGWAASADIFQARWNSSVADVYRIDGFHRDAQGKNTGTFLGGFVYRIDDTSYAATTHDRERFASICAHAAQAALGLSSDSAEALVGAAISQAGASSDGTAKYKGFEVSVATTAGGKELDCLVERATASE